MFLGVLFLAHFLFPKHVSFVAPSTALDHCADSRSSRRSSDSRHGWRASFALCRHDQPAKVHHVIVVTRPLATSLYCIFLDDATWQLVLSVFFVHHCRHEVATVSPPHATVAVSCPPTSVHYSDQQRTAMHVCPCTPKSRDVAFSKLDPFFRRAHSQLASAFVGRNSCRPVQRNLQLPSAARRALRESLSVVLTQRMNARCIVLASIS